MTKFKTDRVCPKCSTFKYADAFRQHLWCIECANAHGRKWHKKNKERARKNHQTFLASHPGYYSSEEARTKQQAVSRKYYEENKEAYRAKHRAYYRANKQKYMEALHRRRVRKRQGGGSFSWTEFTDLCNRYGHCCLRCGDRTSKLTPDHVIPIVCGGSNSIHNIQPLCLVCNISKGSKIIDYRI